VSDENRKKPSIIRVGLGVILLIGVFLAVFFFLPWLVMGKQDALDIAKILAWMFGVGVVLGVPVFLINLALDRKGKLLKVLELVNLICSVVGVLAGVIALLMGAIELYNEDWKLFLVVAGASAFAIYFHVQKYDQSHPTKPHDH
jgi:O-antigen/teichoic acid export membrane protein